MPLHAQWISANVSFVEKDLTLSDDDVSSGMNIIQVLSIYAQFKMQVARKDGWIFCSDFQSPRGALVPRTSAPQVPTRFDACSDVKVCGEKISIQTRPAR